MRPRVSAWSTAAFLVLGLVAMFGMLWNALPSRATPTHDEGITFLAATGHLEVYQDATVRRPSVTWTRAVDWQRLWSLDDVFCFRRISRDLASVDIHPPLYFWLLHTWLVAAGVTVRAGLLLNAALALLTGGLLYGLGRHVTGSRGAAVVSVLLWALSPSVLSVAMQARQYELLGLLAVAFCWQLMRCADSERVPDLWNHAVLAFATAAGLLTHYHFAILIVAGGLVATLQLRKAPWSRLIALGAALAGGIVLFVALHPDFAHSFALQQHQRQGFDWIAAVARARRAARQASRFAGLGVTRIIWLAAGVWTFAGLALIARHRLRRGSAADPCADRLLRALAILGFVYGAIAGLYIAFVSPLHAMAPQYLSMAWPLLAVVVAGVLWRTRPGRAAAVILCSIMLLAGAHWARTVDRAESSNVFTPDASRPVLLDTIGRGVLPRVLWHAEPQCRVFAADQRYLLAHVDDWLPGLGDHAVYVSSPLYGNDEAGRRELLETLSARYLVRDGPAPLAHGLVAILDRKPGDGDLQDSDGSPSPARGAVGPGIPQESSRRR